MGQVFTALRHAIQFAFGGHLSNHLFAKLPVPNSDLTGRTFILTGSNTGIGLAAAVHLARLNPAYLILGVRDLKKGEIAKSQIIAETGCSAVIDVWELDMADFGSVKKFAERAGTLERLDGALLNAGMNASTWQTTSDGWERTLQVNALSQGLLGVLLLPSLCATAARPDASPHLTFTGSAAMFFSSFPEKYAPNILQALNDPAKSSVEDRYPVSKLFNLYTVREIARLPRAQGVVVNVVEPGFCVSELMREHNFNAFVTFVYNRIGWSSAKGSLNLLYAALKPTPPGAYISACKIRQPESWTSNKEGLEVQKRVWNEMVGVWCRIAPEVATIVQT
ncbi:putative short-chain dehydrogenase [Mycena sanguinolenta]|nr:putative short-chain dehydrogenase [Mycena sanguinolenta]